MANDQTAHLNDLILQKIKTHMSPPAIGSTSCSAYMSLQNTSVPQQTSMQIKESVMDSHAEFSKQHRQLAVVEQETITSRSCLPIISSHNCISDGWNQSTLLASDSMQPCIDVMSSGCCSGPLQPAWQSMYESTSGTIKNIAIAQMQQHQDHCNTTTMTLSRESVEDSHDVYRHGFEMHRPLVTEKGGVVVGSSKYISDSAAVPLMKNKHCTAISGHPSAADACCSVLRPTSKVVSNHGECKQSVGNNIVPTNGTGLDVLTSASHHLLQQDDKVDVQASVWRTVVGGGSQDLNPEQKEMVYRAAALQPIDLSAMSSSAEELDLHKPKPRRNVRISKDPQSVAARQRRQRISTKMRVLQRLVPGGTKMDTASMLEEAALYLKFLKAEVEKMEAIDQLISTVVTAGRFNSKPNYPVKPSSNNTKLAVQAPTQQNMSLVDPKPSALCTPSTQYPGQVEYLNHASVSF